MWQAYYGLASFLLFLNLVKLCFQMPNNSPQTLKIREKIENTSPNHFILWKSAISKRWSCFFSKCFTQSWTEKKKKTQNRSMLWESLRYLLTNLYSMRFPAPTEAPRGNEPHLGCCTCWLSQPLETKCARQMGDSIIQVVFLKSRLNIKITHSQTNKQIIKTINLQFLTNFETSLKLQSPTLIPVA